VLVGEGGARDGEEGEAHLLGPALHHGGHGLRRRLLPSAPQVEGLRVAILGVFLFVFSDSS
jgi:hypothetical protein